MKIIYFDCYAGISGDMTVGSLLDLGVPLEHLQAELAKLGLPDDSCQLSTSRTERRHIPALKFDVAVHDHHSHRHYAGIDAMIAESGLPDGVKDCARKIFRRLAEAEALVHGVAIEQVHFHEVGAVDSIVDIVGTAICLNYLGVEAVYASALPLGGGFVETAHGRLPVPAPATAELLKGLSVHGECGNGERVTPTGAAIIAALANCCGARPNMKVERIGSGAGGKDFPDCPNIMRAFLGTIEISAAVSDEIMVVESNIDDSSAEVLGYTMGRLLEQGALDVYFTPIQMKKNRPATMLSFLCYPEQLDSLCTLALSETSAIGLRYYFVSRVKLERRVEERNTQFGPMRFKIISNVSGMSRITPEYEDSQRVAREQGIPLQRVMQELAGVEKGGVVRITILSIGDELISGRITDTNAGTISAVLLEQGLKVQSHVTVGDSEMDIISVLSELERHSDYIIATGGLGPTADDMTTHAVARATGRRLVVNDEAKEHVQKMSARLNTLIAAPLNDKQAMLPSKTTIIPNLTGTACGFQLMHNNCHMFFMPGVPSEMLPMLNESVLPFLLERQPKKQVLQFRHLNVFGPREAEVDELLAGIAVPQEGLQMGICVSYPAMKITFRAEADSQAVAEAKLLPAINAAYLKIGRFIYSEGDVTLAEKVAALLRENGKTLALAESCTGGMISQFITAIPGSSEFFLEGAVTYSNVAKQNRLGVPAEIIVAHGAVSRETAADMAIGIRSSAASDIGLSVTGIAGPDGGSTEKPVGTVYISLAAADGCWTERYKFGGNREDIRIATTWMALDRLRCYLLDGK